MTQNDKTPDVAELEDDYRDLKKSYNTMCTAAHQWKWKYEQTQKGVHKMSDVHIHYDEYDLNELHPMLVIQSDKVTAGYDINLDTGELTQVCICAARSSNECCCDYNWEGE